MTANTFINASFALGQYGTEQAGATFRIHKSVFDQAKIVPDNSSFWKLYEFHVIKQVPHVEPLLNIAYLTHWSLEDVVVILKVKSSNIGNIIKFMSTSCEAALRWMPHDFTDDQSTLVHKTSLMISQHWSTRLHWWLVNIGPQDITDD